MSRYRKAIAAAISTIVLFLLFGGDVEPVKVAISTLITTFTVWALPNDPPGPQP